MATKTDGLRDSIKQYRNELLRLELFELKFPDRVSEYNEFLKGVYASYNEAVDMGANHLAPPPPYKEVM
jgi:hypothetical protein